MSLLLTLHTLNQKGMIFWRRHLRINIFILISCFVFSYEAFYHRGDISNFQYAMNVIFMVLYRDINDMLIYFVVEYLYAF